MKKLLLSLFFAGAFFLFLPREVLAADLDIDCPTSTACSKTGVDPLFRSAIDGYWYPGKSITKTLNLKNSGSETREMAIKGTRTSTINILENVMQISIVGGTTVIWDGSVADFYNVVDKIGMGTFASGANLDYNFTVFMSSDANDTYQGKETVFDLTLGFWGEPASSGDGTALGTGVSSSDCSDAKPGSAPTLTSAAAGTNSVTLFWNKASDPVTYYLISYRTAGGAQYGNPNVGGSSTTSYTVGNLSGDVIYYFKVRAGNGCMPGDFSNELSATPGGGTVQGPAQGFAPGVLGTTENINSGISTENPSLIKFWWVPLLIFFGGLLLWWILGKIRGNENH